MSAPLARVVRSGLEESVHLGDVAVCDAEGRVLAFAGDPARRIYSRSSMKPLQATVSLSAIGEAFELPDREVAVMCASHNAEPVHLETVAALLSRAGLGEDALRCPPGWPLDPASMANAGRQRPILHNCSGKHAGKLLACVCAGWDVETYLDSDHPLQHRILEAVRLGTGVEDIHVGVDGCGSPVHGMPLSGMATLFARLATPERLGGLEEFARRGTGAMLAEPYLVAGRGRVDTAVMEAARDVFVKGGAEGLLCAGHLGSGLGIAIKSADGAARPTGPALIAVLRQLDLATDEQLDAFAAEARPVVLGGGRPVGEVEAVVALSRV